MKTLGKTTFRDYHYNLKEVKYLFTINSIDVLERTKIVKIPRWVFHFFICLLHLKFLIKVVERFEKHNFGANEHH